jgi:hypothetical protein
MGGGHFDLGAALTRNRDGIGLSCDLQGNIDADGGVAVHGQIQFALCSKSLGRDGKSVVANRKIWKRVQALSVGDSMIWGAQGVVDEGEPP